MKWKGSRTANHQPYRAVFLALIVVVSMIVGVGVFTTPATAAQTVSNQRDIASHADSTTQQFSFSFDLPPSSITCTLKTSNTLGQYGITLKSASVSGTNKLTMNVKSNGDVDMTLKSGSGKASATVTLTMSTETVTIPDKTVSHKSQCSGSTSSAATDPIKSQASGFKIQETGIKNTSKTKIQSDDTTITNDTTMTQSIDLDLVVPDDGDSDGDKYNVTIDTRQAQANGINITGIAVENDPSGANAQIEVVSTSVTSDENATVTIREASADHSDGNVSREVITVGLDLDSTQHDAGTFTADNSINHVIRDEAGNTTSRVSFASKISNNQSGGSNGGNQNKTGSTNQTTTVDVTMNGAPNGLRKYSINLTGPAGSSISNVTQGFGFGTFQINNGGKNNSFATVREVDIVGGGAASFSGTKTLFTVKFSGNYTKADFDKTVLQLSDKNGTTINSSRISLSVTTPQSGSGKAPNFNKPIPGTGAKNPPKDSDGDGKTEDVDGDGKKSFDDALALAFADTSDLTQAQKNALDFDNDGDVDFDDAIELAFL